MPLPGSVAFEDVKIQLIDTPPITAEHVPPGFPGLWRSADALIVVADVSSDSVLEDTETCMNHLAERRIELTEGPRQLPDDPGAIRPATPFIYHYAVEAMLMNAMTDEAVQLLHNYWGKMLSLGASTFWEVFNPEDHRESPYGNYLLNSYCHSWSCTPAYLIRKYLSIPDGRKHTSTGETL